MIGKPRPPKKREVKAKQKQKIVHLLCVNRCMSCIYTIPFPEFSYILTPSPHFWKILEPVVIELIRTRHLS